VPSLGATYGRGAATTAQWDLQNAQCVVIMGSNMAENHPVAFRFVMAARERGATIIHVDPRFTRTSAVADVYAPLRPGSDIAFLGGLIRYILDSERWHTDPFFKEFTLNYTNLATVIEDGFMDASELGGLFSGWQPDKRTYNIASWQYLGEVMPSPLAEHHTTTTEAFSEKLHRLENGPPASDPTLTNPQCVYQILKRQYAAYTPEMVERVTGCPREAFVRVADALLANAGRDRTTAWCYAVGWTHHTTGVQTIRAAAIIQALLGNIGRPGGGVLALRGHSSIQGSTDIPTLYNLLPGYLPQPSALKPHKSFDEYLEAENSGTGYWANFPKFAVSLLRAWYGEHATPDNGWGFDWLPKMTGDHSQLPMMLAMRDGNIKGLFLVGQNPVIGGHNSHMIRMALPNLDWMVVREVFENDTASYWYRSPEALAGELRAQHIKTEMFLLPASLPGEKEGTFTNTQRLIQWHDKVVEPRRDIRSDLWFFFHLGKRLKQLYADSTDPADAPIQNLTWDYPTDGPAAEPSAEAVLKEINGYTWPGRTQIASFDDLKDDGSTACGCWIYTGAYPRDDHNQTRSRKADSADGPGTHLGWAFAWPANRRIMYNRASADPQGRPWSEAKRYVWWDAEQRKWVGHDVPDFTATTPPDYEPDWSKHPHGMEAIDGRSPFIMMADGKSHIFAPSALKDGPLPTHYEPVESPISNPMYPQQNNPAVKKWERPDNQYHAVDDPRYPYVMTTYRLTEHHCGGPPTRMIPATAELQPEAFVELPPELARELDVQSLDWVVVSTARGDVEAKALVTERLQPLRVAGRSIYQVGMPWHFGWQGLANGDPANILTSVVADPNTTIHEAKAFTCNVRKGRLARPQQEKV